MAEVRRTCLFNLAFPRMFSHHYSWNQAAKMGKNGIAASSCAGSVQPTTAQDFLPVIYQELRRIAAEQLKHEKPGQTLQPTALVHEAWLRLIRNESQEWANSSHFFGAAAEAMRRILVENARRKQAKKRGANPVRVDLDWAELPSPMPDEQLLALDEALEELATNHPLAAALIKLRFFAGLTQAEAARELGLSQREARAEWLFGRVFLFKRIQEDSPQI